MPHEGTLAWPGPGLERRLAPARAVIQLDATTKAFAVEHHLWLLHGSLAVDVTGTSIELSAGDCLRWLATEAVRVYNPGKREARYLIAIVR